MARAHSDLLVLPVVALLDAPLDAAAVADALAEQGVRVSPAWSGELLERAAALGLARIAAAGDGAPRFVATALGRRSAVALVARDPELRVGLEELERLRSELLATIGHELRTPLTAIRTSAGLLLDPGLTPTVTQRQQLLATIGRSADRMQRLLTELLDLARLRSGALELHRARFDARDVLRDVAAMLAPIVASREQRLRVASPDDELPVFGDRERLERAVLHLASNAQKFSPAGSDIDLRVAADGGQVRWTVTDRGPGIGAAEQARLFERFFVGASDRDGRRGGAGIGLPTALAIAQAHGGTIEVDSQVGRGSTFHLVVPATSP
jgi:signal transduction histidine kinase